MVAAVAPRLKSANIGLKGNLMATLKLEIVTPDKSAFQGEVHSVVIPASEGEMEILPMHIALVTRITPGE